MGRPKTIETEDLLVVAREVFLESGAFGSTKDIARRAGISESALFKRFPTKAALFLAAMAPPPADIDAMLGKARAEKDPRRGVQRLVREMLAYYRMALPRMLPLMTHPAIGLAEARRHINSIGAAHMDAGIVRYVQEQNDEGRLNAPNPRAAAGLLVATLHSVVLFELIGVHGGAMPDAAIEAMIDVMWLGLAPSKPVSKRRKSK